MSLNQAMADNAVALAQKAVDADSAYNANMFAEAAHKLTLAVSVLHYIAQPQFAPTTLPGCAGGIVPCGAVEGNEGGID